MRISNWAALGLLPFTFSVNAGQWSAGPVAIAQASPYIGGEDGFMFFPGVAYEGEKLKVRGPFVDYFVLGNGRGEISIALTLALGPNQLEVDGDEILDGIEDRDSGLLGGVRLDYPMLGGTASLALQTDITDESDGQRVVAGWQKPFFDSDPSKWIFTAGFQIEWVSDDYANYYYGITAEEAAVSSFDEYIVDSTVQPSLTIGGYYNFSEKWQFIYNMEYQLLASDVEDSPIVKDSSALSGVLGIVYLF